VIVRSSLLEEAHTHGPVEAGGIGASLPWRRHAVALPAARRRYPVPVRATSSRAWRCLPRAWACLEPWPGLWRRRRPVAVRASAAPVPTCPLPKSRPQRSRGTVVLSGIDRPRTGCPSPARVPAPGGQEVRQRCRRHGSDAPDTACLYGPCVCASSSRLLRTITATAFSAPAAKPPARIRRPPRQTGISARCVPRHRAPRTIPAGQDVVAHLRCQLVPTWHTSVSISSTMA